MRKKTLSIVAALFMCACGAWAQVTTITDGATYRVRCNAKSDKADFTNRYWSPTTTPVLLEEAGLFKFVAVTGKDGAYTIQSLSNNNQWLTYTLAGSYNNQRNWLTFGETAGEFKAEYVTGSGGAEGVNGFTIAPANSTGWASKNLNWYEGVDQNYDNTLGLWKDKETDKGSIWTLELVEDTQNPGGETGDAALEAAKAEFEKYMDEVVAPIFAEMYEIPQELYTDEFSAVCEELFEKVYEYYDYEKEEYIPLASVAAYETAKQELSALIANYEKTKPNVPGEASDAQKAFDAALAQLQALFDKYVEDLDADENLIYKDDNISYNLKGKLVEAYQVLWGYSKGSFGYPTTDEGFVSCLVFVQESLDNLTAAIENEPTTPDVAHFPEAGTYYVTFTGQATDGRKNSLYNDLTQADGFTLQSDKPEVVTNNYVWRVVSDGQGKMTLRNGQGSTMKLCSGQNPVITELGYEAHNNAYYLLTSAQGITKNHNCLNVSDGGYKNAAGTPAVTTWSTNAGPDAGDNHWAVTEVAASSVYNVVVEGNEEGYAILGSEYAGNNGFFLSSDVANVAAKKIAHYTASVSIEETSKTIKVNYTLDEEPVTVTYKVYVDNDVVCGFEKMEYVGDAPSFNAEIPAYVNAVIPEVIPENAIVEIHTSYKEGALPFDVNGNYNLALNRTPNLNIYVDAEGGIHTQNVASTEETEDNYVWTIGGDWYNGFTLKSKAAEKYVSFGSANPTNKYKATLVEGTGEGATFDLVQAGGNNYFKIHGTTTDAYISNNGGVGTTFLTNWNDAGNIGDAGAQFIFTKVEDAPEVDPAIAEAKAALDEYLENVVAPLLAEYEELEDEQITDELAAAYEELLETAMSYEEGLVTLTTADDYKAALATLTTLVADYNDAKTTTPEVDPEALAAAKAAYDAAHLKCTNLAVAYGPYVYENEEVATVFNQLMEIEWLVNEDNATIDQYNAITAQANAILAEAEVKLAAAEPEFSAAMTEVNEMIAKVNEIVTNYKYVASNGTAACDKISELVDTAYGYSSYLLNLPTSVEEAQAAVATMKDAIKAFFESCTIQILVNVINENSDNTLNKVDEIKAGILKTYSLDEDAQK